MIVSLGQCAQLACQWEVTVRKAGNVHRQRDFPDLTYADFLASAAAIVPAFDRAEVQPIGQTVLDAITATQAAVHTNTNLGIVLLLAPMAAVPRQLSLSEGLPSVLERLDVEDSRLVYQAIRLAKPGGLGHTQAEDVREEPTLPLRAAMALAAERDLVARQYANGYREVLDFGLPRLLETFERTDDLEPAIIRTHLQFMAEFPDSLIARKLGQDMANQAALGARAVLRGDATFESFDAWLTADGNARNPGTSADLVTACLFAALRDIRLPPWLTLAAPVSPLR